MWKIYINECRTLLKGHIFFTSLAKGAYDFGSVGCLSLCLFVCKQHYSKSYKRIVMKFYGGVGDDRIKKYGISVVIWVF